MIFACVWGFIVGLILTAGFDLYLDQFAWWFWMLVLNLFGNFALAPAIFDKKDL